MSAQCSHTQVAKVVVDVDKNETEPEQKTLKNGSHVNNSMHFVGTEKKHWVRGKVNVLSIHCRIQVFFRRMQLISLCSSHSDRITEMGGSVSISEQRN